MIISSATVSPSLSIGVTATLMRAPLSFDLLLMTLACSSCKWRWTNLVDKIGTILINADVTEEGDMLVISATAFSKSDFSSLKEVSLIPVIVRLKDIGKISTVSAKWNIYVILGCNIIVAIKFYNSY